MAWVLGTTMLVIAACAVIVWALQVFQLTGGGEAHAEHVDVVPPSQPFSQPQHPEVQRRATRDALDEWSWADRSTRRVRVPVDVAIERYLQDGGNR
jgi:hypothetical protein